MDTKEIDDVIKFFGRARNKYDKLNMKDRAQSCDDAIALAQNVIIELAILSDRLSSPSLQ
jgi:hypothetical protein